MQAGVVLERLDGVLADQGLMVPLDLGAKVSAGTVQHLATREAVISEAMSALTLEVSGCSGNSTDYLIYEALGEYGPISIQWGSIFQLTKININSFI